MMKHQWFALRSPRRTANKMSPPSPALLNLSHTVCTPRRYIQRNMNQLRTKYTRMEPRRTIRAHN